MVMKTIHVNIYKNSELFTTLSANEAIYKIGKKKILFKESIVKLVFRFRY